MSETKTPESRIFYSEKGKLIYYPFEDFKDRAKIVFESKDCGEVILEANSLLHVIIDYLSENPNLVGFSAKALRINMIADGRFIDHDYYLRELPSRIGKKLTFMTKKYPSKISATTNHNMYSNQNARLFNLYQIKDPFQKRTEQTISYM